MKSKPIDAAMALESQLRALHADAMKQPPAGSFTAIQYADLNRCTAAVARDRIEDLCRIGRAKRLGQFRTADPSGRHRLNAFFQLIPAKK